MDRISDVACAVANARECEAGALDRVRNAAKIRAVRPDVADSEIEGAWMLRNIAEQHWLDAVCCILAD